MNFYKPMLFVLVLFFVTKNTLAQEPVTLTLQDAVQLALENSDRSKISRDKVTIAGDELRVTKNLRYPDAKISGQYQYLTNAKVDLQTGSGDDNGGDDGGDGDSGTGIPNVNQLFLGQASITMPVFTGFKLKNAVAASDNDYKAATYTAANDKEQIALKTIKDYIDLYKAKQSIGLIKENLKSAQQRVKDFTDMEQNGLLAKNDLLKANLQQSNIEVALAEALKNESILNYQLAVTLKLPENTHINTVESEFGVVSEPMVTDSISRNDLEALSYQEQAAENKIGRASCRERV